jgi:hypothetical protein
MLRFRRARALAGGRADVHARCAPEIVWVMRRRALPLLGRLHAIVMVENRWLKAISAALI